MTQNAETHAQWLRESGGANSGIAMSIGEEGVRP
jgi:hypothetical protein